MNNKIAVLGAKGFVGSNLVRHLSKQNTVFPVTRATIDLLDANEKNDFRDFVNTEISFNPHNMFICKNREMIIKYYNSLFPWLERCEKIFGFATLDTYGLKRIYGFLAERYMSYWFKKYTKFHLMKIHFKDLSDFI